MNEELASYIRDKSIDDLQDIIHHINVLILERKVQSPLVSDKKKYGRCYYLVKKNNEGTITPRELEELHQLKPSYIRCKWMINSRPIPDLD